MSGGGLYAQRSILGSKRHALPSLAAVLEQKTGREKHRAGRTMGAKIR